MTDLDLTFQVKGACQEVIARQEYIDSFPKSTSIEQPWSLERASCSDFPATKSKDMTEDEAIETHAML